VVFVQCAGSRDRRHKEYCSKVCCMYATKNARLIKREMPDVDVRVCYTTSGLPVADMRSTSTS